MWFGVWKFRKFNIGVACASTFHLCFNGHTRKKQGNSDFDFKPWVHIFVFSWWKMGISWFQNKEKISWF
jgi:hypothetical protein